MERQSIMKTSWDASNSSWRFFFVEVPKSYSSIYVSTHRNPWDEQYIYLHERLMFMVNVGHYYTSPMDPMGYSYITYMLTLSSKLPITSPMFHSSPLTKFGNPKFWNGSFSKHHFSIFNVLFPRPFLKKLWSIPQVDHEKKSTSFRGWGMLKKFSSNVLRNLRKHRGN